MRLLIRVAASRLLTPTTLTGCVYSPLFSHGNSVASTCFVSNQVRYALFPSRIHEHCLPRPLDFCHIYALLSVIFSTEPLWATLVSGVFLKETMGPNALIGAGVILLACLVAQSEQIVELLGMGAKESEQLLDQAQSDNFSGVDVDESPSVIGEEMEMDNFPSSVFDEIEPAGEESFDVATVQEYTLPAGVYTEGSPFDDREVNDLPAVRVGWFGSMASD